MESELRAWLARTGFPQQTALVRMDGNLGSTDMWSILPSANAAPMVARLFAEGADAAAEREWIAMQVAARNGVAVPVTMLRGTVGNRPVVVMTFVPGELAWRALLDNPSGAHGFGVAMGHTLGRIHQICAPAGLISTSTTWIEKGGPSIESIHHLLAALPRQDRLLHLDYHLNNVLIDQHAVAGVIDWENATAGPPHMDLARSRAILRVIDLGNRIPPGYHPVFKEFERGLDAGHASIMGVDPHPRLSTAWGLAMTVDDLVRQLGKANDWLTEALVEHLANERDKQIGWLLAG